MRITVLVPSLELGGAERSAVKFVQAIRTDVEHVAIICMAQADARVLAELSPGVKVQVMSARSTANPLLWLRIGRQLRRDKPNVIVGWSTYANLVAALVSRFLPGSRVILSERNYVPQMFRRGRTTAIRRRVVLALMRSMYSMADAVTANSSENVRFLRKYVGGRSCYRWLPNCIDVSGSDRLAAGKTKLPTAGSAGPRLLAIGRLDAQKGFDLLLEAIARVRLHRPWELAIVGDGPEKEALELQSERLGLGGAIHWVGAVANPFPYYRWADVVVMPSRYEGFPNVLLEAMALGRAVIACDCKTGPRELTEGGRFGVLVPVGDIAALADAILALGADPERCVRLGATARSHVLDVYDVAAVRGRYLDLLTVPE